MTFLVTNSYQIPESLYFIYNKVLHKSLTSVNVSSNEPYFGVRHSRDFIFHLFFRKEKINTSSIKDLHIYYTKVFISISILFCGVTVALYFFFDYSKPFNYKY